MKIYGCLFISLVAVSLCAAELTMHGAGLIALDEDGDPGLRLSGSAMGFEVIGGGIHVNSTRSNAMEVDGYVSFPQIDYINIVGEFDPSNKGYYPYDSDGNPVPIYAAPDVVVAPIPDPLCPGGVNSNDCLPEPIYSTVVDLGTISDANTYSPGYYSGGIETTGGPIYLEPGIYHLGGGAEGKGGLVIGGNTAFYADGVMFHILPDHTNADGVYIEPGKVDIAGTSSIFLAPIDSNSIYDDIIIFQSRTNYSDARIVGTGLLDLYGTLYFPENHLDLRGEGVFGNQIIASTIDVRGDGTMTIKYDGRNAYMSGDFDFNQTVDFYDLSYFVGQWLADYDAPADLNYDHRVDLADFAIIAENWMHLLE